MVGQYAVAFQIAQLFLVLPTVCFGAIYPRLVHLHTHDPARYRTVLNICYYGFTLMGYAIMVFCWLFGRQLIHAAFGSKYDLAGQIVVVLAIANIFSFSGAVRGLSITITNSTHYHIWNVLAGLLIVVPTSWFIIPIYGALGAAVCISFAYFVSGVCTTFFLRKVRADAIVQLKALFLIPSFHLSDI
jgi:O-antigen/teichoic acid export membrane protein